MTDRSGNNNTRGLAIRPTETEAVIGLMEESTKAMGKAVLAMERGAAYMGTDGYLARVRLARAQKGLEMAAELLAKASKGWPV